MVKKYFYIKKLEGGASKEFVRYVFHLQDPTKFLIHYVGDSVASEEHPHGNQKKNRDIRKFFRTKPSSLNEWAKQCEVENPNKTYKLEVAKEKDNVKVTDKPRDLKQLQNARHKFSSGQRLSRDGLYNLH